MSQNIMEHYQEEVILAEANIVRAKQKERKVMMEVQGLSLDEIMGARMELDLVHEEKILAQEAFIMKRRQMELSKEECEQTQVVVSSIADFVQVLFSFLEMEEVEEDGFCLFHALLQKVEDIEEQVSQMTVNSTQELLQKLSELRNFIVENADEINKD